MGAFYTSPVASVTTGNNAFGPSVTVATAPFAARRMAVFFSSSTGAAGAIQISIGSTVIVPFFPAGGSGAFTPNLSFDLFIPKGAAINVVGANYNTTGTLSVSVVLFSESPEELIGRSVVTPGISLSNANFQVTSEGANVWTALGSALAQPTKNIQLLFNSDAPALDVSLGYGTSASAVTPIIDAVPSANNGSYTWNLAEARVRIPAGQTLYAKTSVGGSAFWPMVTI
jgi:hypothetical protein